MHGIGQVIWQDALLLSSPRQGKQLAGIVLEGGGGGDTGLEMSQTQWNRLSDILSSQR